MYLELDSGHWPPEGTRSQYPPWKRKGFDFEKAEMPIEPADCDLELIVSKLFSCKKSVITFVGCSATLTSLFMFRKTLCRWQGCLTRGAA